MSIGPLKSVDPRAAAGAERTAPKDRALAQAASEMETVFVRHLLEASKIGGPSAQSGYGSMAVDALASGIERGGGIGLARRIEEALSPHTRPVATAAAHALAPVAHPPSPAPSVDGTKPVGVPAIPFFRDPPRDPDLTQRPMPGRPDLDPPARR